jgi:hypothetical protein
MTRKTFLGGIAALCATVFVSAGLLAQEKSGEQMSPQEQAMMEAWAKYMTPGEPHQKLAERAGKWTYTGRMWAEPGADPVEFEGTATITSIMGGRYILEKAQGPFMDRPFTGMGIFGYDNLTQSYVGAWVDNLGTGIMRYEGTASDDGSTIRWVGDAPDLLNGRYQQSRSVDRTIDPDHAVSTFYATTPDGDEYQHMELRYSRVK